MIICVIAKLFEKLIYNLVSKYVENNNILSPSQSGFMQEYFTTSALLKLTNDVYIALDSGDLTGDIFIDLKKAFVLVDHVLLLDKLYVGFSQYSLLWFNSYLHNMWLSKINTLIHLLKKEWYHRAQYWVLFFFLFL